MQAIYKLGRISLALLFVGSASIAADYVIGPGDLLQVRVFGDASGLLSGPFRVQSDGVIDFPVVGQIAVAGKSIQNASELLTASLSKQNIDATANILISEYAPVFVIGDVGRTGSFPFRPGLTIFDVVAEMGGIPVGGDVRAQIAAAEKERADLEYLEFSLAVQAARLQAEISHKEFDPTQFATASDENKSFVATQEAIFDAHKRNLAALKESLQAQERTYVQEAESLKQSIVLHDQEVTSIEEQARSQQALAQKGLVTQSKVLELSRELSVTRREALEFQTALFRAEQNRLLTLQKIDEAEPDAESLNLDLLAKAEADLSRTRLSLLATRNTLAFMRGELNGRRTSLGRTAVFTLIRSTARGRTEIAADETTSLQRGDILRVDLPSAPGNTLVSTSSRAAPIDPMEAPDNPVGLSPATLPLTSKP